jgi:hypothetical protein
MKEKKEPTDDISVNDTRSHGPETHTVCTPFCNVRTK